MKPGLSQHEHRRETVLGTLLKTSARIWVPDMSHLIKLLCHKKKKNSLEKLGVLRSLPGPGLGTIFAARQFYLEGSDSPHLH